MNSVVLDMHQIGRVQELAGVEDITGKRNSMGIGTWIKEHGRF